MNNIIQDYIELAKIKLKEMVRFYYWQLIEKKSDNYLKSKEILRSWKASHPNLISAIVFSKDRAMQLHALLASFFETKIGECSIVVIYKCSNGEHKKAYKIVEQIFGEKVKFFDQESHLSFRDCLEFVVSQTPSGKLFFLVDDIVFTEDVDYPILASLDLTETIFSLRMGEHLVYSYVVDKIQPLPAALVRNKQFLSWKWSEGVHDWRYPLSVDGHIFSTEEVRLFVKYLDFSSPSSFENSLQNLRYIYLNKRGLSYKKARIVNIPANIVQNEVNNFHGSVHQEDLLRQWLNGMAIDHLKFRGLVNHSVHQEVDFHLIKREEE